MTPKFRHPKEFAKKKARIPISARLDKEIKIYLETAAKKNELTFGELIEGVLEDYSKFLKSGGKVRKKP